MNNHLKNAGSPAPWTKGKLGGQQAPL